MGGTAGRLSPSLIELAAGTIERHAMLAGGERVLAAVSGGPDSVTLLHVLHALAPRLSLSLSVVHVDHALRPDSARDADFVRMLGARYGVAVEVARVALPTGCDEATARRARHAALETVAVRLEPLVRYHTEASALSNNLRGPRPVEPVLLHPEELEEACPADLQDLLAGVLACRAARTACMLGYWGRWREGRALLRRFRRSGAWSQSIFGIAQLAASPLGALAGKAWRFLRRTGPILQHSSNGHPA